jgi:hypothetical protein
MSVSRKLLREFIDQSRLSLLAALFAVLLTSALSAQIVETGVITGVVRDSAGAVVVKDWRATPSRTHRGSMFCRHSTPVTITWR